MELLLLARTANSRRCTLPSARRCGASGPTVNGAQTTRLTHIFRQMLQCTLMTAEPESEGGRRRRLAHWRILWVSARSGSSI